MQRIHECIISAPVANCTSRNCESARSQLTACLSESETRTNEPQKTNSPGFLNTIGLNPMLGAFQPYTAVHFPAEPVFETKTRKREKNNVYGINRG